MRKRLVLLVVLVFLAGSGVVAAWVVLGRSNGDVGTLVLQGNVDIRQVNLAFKTAGRISKMTAEEGDTVKAGDVVAVLDQRYAEDDIRLEKARVAAQAAVVARLENGSRPEELAQARAQVAERQAAAANARQTLGRKQELAGRGFSPHQAHDDALAAVDEAQAQLAVAQQTLKLVEIGPRQEDIAAARGELDAERVRLAQAEQQLVDTELLAPSAGVIQTRVREPGAIVAAGETVYALTLTSPVWVRAYVEEPDLARARSGMTVNVTADTVGGNSYLGQIGFVSPVAEFTPKTVETRALRTSLVYRLRIVVANPDGALRQGMPVTVTLQPADRS